MKTIFIGLPFVKKNIVTFIAGLLLFLISSNVQAQLGTYAFTGAGACPNQNPAVTTQPANAVFSDFTTVATTCVAMANEFKTKGWNLSNTIDLTEYNEFTITPNAGYNLTLNNLTFTEFTDVPQFFGCTWALRSSIDGYASNLATGFASSFQFTYPVTLPAASFTSVGPVTFRLYIISIDAATTSWTLDNVTLNGSVYIPPVDPADPTSNSPQCQTPGVTLTNNASVPAGETWYWQTTANGTSTANSGPTYTATTTGTYYIRARNNTTLGWSAGSGSVAVDVTPNATIPVFNAGAASTRCQGAGVITYTANSTNATNLIYSLDASSTAAGNTIDSLSGDLTYVAGWTGNSVITAIATGCNGDVTGTHTASTTPTVSTPVFGLGTSSNRCVAGNVVSYAANNNNNSGITYTLSPAAAGTINTTNGNVNYSGTWVGTATITARGAGCNGPVFGTHTAITSGPVSNPVFVLGPNSIHCQGISPVTYTANAANTTGITYSLDATTSAFPGNSIDPSNGTVIFAAGWSGTSVITASAVGCVPKTANHTCTITPTVGTPVFAAGATSVRCRASGNVTYNVSASNNTGIAYSLDPGSTGVSILSSNATSVTLSYTGGWSGVTILTATANGCNGPKTATHNITTSDFVATPLFTLGTGSTRCQGATEVTYTATAINSTSITYTLDGTTSGFPGNSIVASTGAVTFAAGWSGTSTITATAAGCSGPRTATHTVTTTPTVGIPIFALGSTSTRCQLGAMVTYTANASNNTGISYSLDALSQAGGNNINSSGQLTYDPAWAGTTTITATASGCNGPVSSTHTVTITPTVGIPVFVAGSTSVRCQGSGSVTYTASASNNVTLRYSIDAASGVLNSIDAIYGTVVWAAGWSGTSTITATATGCNGPRTATHIVTITPSVGTPVFALGNNSSRCNGAGTVTYSASAANNTAIKYYLDAASKAAGNTIDSVFAVVTYVAGWTGTTTITAKATGCNGPKTATHTVINLANVGIPVFSMGTVSSRQQSAAIITYTATATAYSGIIYILDAASKMAGNIIDTTNGKVTYVATWSGITTITAYASGCNGPNSSTHTVFINPTVVGIPLYLSDPAQALDRVDPVITGDNTTASTLTFSSSASAIVVDAASNGFSANPGSTSFSVSHTTGTGAGRFMLVGISYRTVTVTGVTYAGLPLTLVGENTNSGSARVSIYKLVNPPSGASPVIVSFSANPSLGVVVGVTSFTGVNQTSPIGTFATNNNSSSTASVSVTSGSGETVYDVVTFRNNTITASAGQTEKYNLASGNEITGGASIKAGAPSVTMTWNASGGSSQWAMGAISIKPESGINSASFTLAPALCSDLTIKSGINITVTTYANIVTGTMPTSPNITAVLRYGGTTIITLINPVYNSVTGVITWTGQLASNVTVPSGQAISLDITTAQAGVTFTILFDSQTKPSKINLPVTTYIDISSINGYDAPYPGGNIIYTGLNNTTVYVRAVVTAPFGPTDINSMDVTIAPPGANFTASLMATGTCDKTFEYAWTTPAAAGNYDITGTAYEGFEHSVTRVLNFNLNLCSTCPPAAIDDSARGAGGAPIVLNVLANDYDPNNNINVSSLSIITQANNGTGYLTNGKIIYLPNGTYSGKDTLYYQICDSTLPIPLCATAKVVITIDPTLIDPCSDATESHIYYLPFPENEARIALDSSSNQTMPSNNIRSIISIKIPYPGMVIVWDEWEDGYEVNPLNPLQATTKVWGDGNPYNGIASGYANDYFPVGASVVLDNTIPTNPRVQSNIFYDGKDKIYSSGQIAVTQVCGEPANFAVQAMKTNVSSTFEYGTSFTIPVGKNFPSQDFFYTALFIRSAQDSTTVNIDKDNNGSFDTSINLNQGQVYLANGGVLAGATVASTKPIGIDVHFGGNDNFSSRDVPIFPATWYSNTYYSPVPTTHSPDTAVVMLYNSLNRPLNINWSNGAPANGTVTIPAKTTIRFPLALSATNAYKFVNPTGESFTAIEICDSYTPNGGGNSGLEFDWSFNLIAEARLTDYATIAWAPGSIDGSRNDNPIWVTPTANTTIYVKYNGDVVNGGIGVSCGLHYDASFNVNALKYQRILDPNDKDQSGIAIFTCNGAKLAAVYGEDASTAVISSPSWDVGTTIQPFCKQKLIFANDDYARTMINQPVTIPILLNDVGFLAVVNPGSVTTTGLLQPRHGTVSVNVNGTVIYTPNIGYSGNDTFEYNVCSTPSPIVCDVATVYIQISVCPVPLNQNIISGNVFLDKNKDGINNDGGTGYTPAKVYLYIDGNCNGNMDVNELRDSVNVDSSGSYQFITYPEKFVADDFDGTGVTTTCASGNDGDVIWFNSWQDQGDAASPGFCVLPAQTVANTDAEIKLDAGFSYALRLKDKNVSATRRANLSGASYAFLSFSYRKKSATMVATRDVLVQASNDGVTFGNVYTIAGNGTVDAAYVNIYNQDISQYTTGATTYIRFLTNANMTDADTVYIDNVSVHYIKYPQCYITSFNSNLIPSTYHMTTGTTHTMVATNGVTCLSPYDFGVARNSVSISGTLYNDANGITDVQVNGTPIGNLGGTNVFAYLVDSIGKIAFKTGIDAGTGVYSFPLADILTTYSVVISTTDAATGSVAPSDANLPLNWVNTGEAFGNNNAAGMGISGGAPNGTITVKTTLLNVTSVNFGVERLPNSDNKTATYPKNVPGNLYAVPALTGSDPEDGTLGNGNTYKITSLPVGAVLYYNSVSVTLNLVISGFNPALFKIDPDDITHVATFTYAARDAAGEFDPTPATVQIDWLQTLPVKLISFSGRLNGTKVDLNWVTANELNTKQFEVERSGDGRTFSKLATVNARGNTNTPTSYDLVDPVPLQGVNYYRLKMVDVDGKFEYSQIVIIRIDNSVQLVTKVAPNPFTGKIDVYLTLTHNTPVDFRFIDINGRMVFSKSVKGLKGFNWFTINDLDKLPSAPYMLHIKTDDATIVEKLIKQ